MTNIKEILVKYGVPKGVTGQQFEDMDDLVSELIDFYSFDMPYGTLKARDGDPYNWVFDRLDEAGLILGD